MKSMSAAFVAGLLSISLCGWLHAAVAAPIVPRYMVTDLGTLGGATSIAQGTNDTD
jgi:hypothetical protein